MTETEKLFAQYTRGDSMSDQELIQLLNDVRDLTKVCNKARRIVGHATVGYLNVLESNLQGLYQARQTRS